MWPFDLLRSFLPKDYNPDEEILVFVEYLGRVNNGVLVDFLDGEEYTKFRAILGEINNKDTPSMLYIRNYNGKRIIEGTIYRIKRQILTELVERKRISSFGSSEEFHKQIESSFVIGYEISKVESHEDFFGPPVTYPSKFTETEALIDSRISGIIANQYSEGLSIIVRNVGQGNWNEVRKGGTLLMIFDCGAPTFATREKVEEYIGTRQESIIRDKPGLIISHWDVDHFHALLGMSDDTLAGFSYVICRAEPKGNMARRILEKLETNVPRRTFALPPISRDRKEKFVKLIPLASENRNVLLFNSQYHKDRNRSGIVMALRNKSSSVVFSGDCHYYQISNYVLPLLNYSHRHNLIVPHHGGNAGPFKYNLGSIKPASAVISVGKNPYGHPSEKNIGHLHELKFHITQTKCHSDDIVLNM